MPDRSITVVVIAHNVEGKLQQQVRGLMDVLPELGNWFEVLIIDDGSLDETQSIANELASEFPQLRVIHQPMRYGEMAAIRRASQLAKGDVLVVYDATEAPAQFQTLHLMFRRVRSQTELVTPTATVTRVASSDHELRPDHIRVDASPERPASSPYPKIIPKRRHTPQTRQHVSHDEYFAAEERLRNHFRNQAPAATPEAP